MTARRFDLLVTCVLLAFATWYGLRMLAYPAGAGVVPAIAAGIMVVALLVQLLLSLRKPAEPAEPGAHGVAAGRTGPGEHGATAVGAPPHAAVPHAADGSPELDDLTAVRHAVEEQELEQDSYETLIALRGVRRRRFLAITLFSAAFYVGFLLVGFVVTTGVLMAAILLFARERAHVVVIGGLVAAGSAYALVVSLLGIPPLSGYLVP